MVGLWVGLAVMAIGGEEPKTDFSKFLENKYLLSDAQLNESLGKYKKAAKQYLDLSKRTEDPKTKAAFILSAADCFLLMPKNHRALEEYKVLVKEYPLYIPYGHVVEQLRQVAQNFVDGNGTFWGIRDRDAAVEVYRMILHEIPSVHVALQDRLRLSELLVELDRGEEAVNEYQTILKQDPSMVDIRIDLALLLSALSKKHDGDGSRRRAAVRHARLAMEQAPDHERKAELDAVLVDAQEADAASMLEQAKFYMVRSHRRLHAARRYLYDLQLKYPKTKAAAEAAQLLEDYKGLFESVTDEPEAAETSSPEQKK